MFLDRDHFRRLRPERGHRARGSRTDSVHGRCEKITRECREATGSGPSHGCGFRKRVSFCWHSDPTMPLLAQKVATQLECGGNVAGIFLPAA